MDRVEHLYEESSYQAIFEGAPVAMWDEDFSSVKQFLDGLRLSGVSNIRQFLTENPTSIHECIARVRIRHVNRLAREFYGATSEDELIRSFPKLFDEKTCKIFCDEIAALAEGAEMFQAEVLAMTLTGRYRLVQMNVSVVPSATDDWSRLVVAFTDLTERRRLERSLRRANEGLEQFAYAAAHDLREPLRTIALYVQLLHRLTTGVLAEPAQAALKYIVESAARMETLVHDLLVFAQAIETPEITQATRTDATAALREVLADNAAVLQQEGV